MQDFPGNAYSIFSPHRITGPEITSGSGAAKDAFTFQALLFLSSFSLLVNLFAHPLMQIFVKASEMEVIASIRARLEGSFYLGIGWLFSAVRVLLRAVKRAEISVVLTVISLGMRDVALAYLFSAYGGGVAGIWIAIPIGWALWLIYDRTFLPAWSAFRSRSL